MTCFYDARMRAAKRLPILNDLRAVYYDDIEVTVHELRKLESDTNYIALPQTLVKVINYYLDYELLTQVCENCPITAISERLQIDEKYYSYYKPCSNTKFFNRSRKINHVLSNNRKDRTVFFYARLQYSLFLKKYISRDYVSINTSIPYKKLTRIENTYFELDNIEDAAILYCFYDYYELGAKICSICPVHSLYKSENFKNIEKKEE